MCACIATQILFQRGNENQYTSGEVLDFLSLVFVSRSYKMYLFTMFWIRFVILYTAICPTCQLSGTLQSLSLFQFNCPTFTPIVHLQRITLHQFMYVLHCMHHKSHTMLICYNYVMLCYAIGIIISMLDQLSWNRAIECPYLIPVLMLSRLMLLTLYSGTS